MEEGAPRLNVPPAVCLEPQLCHPISCGVPAARANSTPSSTSAVLNPAIEKWTCKQGYSVDGTRGGATYFEIQCGVGGDFLPLEQDCIDIDFCAGNPCGVHGHCYDCSTTGCGEEQQRMSFMQRSVIVARGVRGNERLRLSLRRELPDDCGSQRRPHLSRR